jgi:hypothetical protein
MLWEKRLTEFGLGINEYIIKKSKERYGDDAGISDPNKAKIRVDPTDGPTKQRLKREAGVKSVRKKNLPDMYK